MSDPDTQEDRLTIWMNSNVSRGKAAAAAVHTALDFYGIDHGAVICLGAKPGDIEENCETVIYDAGRTEVEPGSVTAGVYSAVFRAGRAGRAGRAAIDKERALSEMVSEWNIRAADQVEATPEEHCQAFLNAALSVLSLTVEDNDYA